METMQVLVVDDEQSIRRLVEKELGTDRRRITTAGTVETALQFFRQKAFDVVLLDMRLSDGDGLDLGVELEVGDLVPHPGFGDDDE